MSAKPLAEFKRVNPKAEGSPLSMELSKRGPHLRYMTLSKLARTIPSKLRIHSPLEATENLHRGAVTRRYKLRAIAPAHASAHINPLRIQSKQLIMIFRASGLRTQ